MSKRKRKRKRFRDLSIEEQCARLNAAIVKAEVARRAPRKAPPHIVRGCLIEETPEGVKVTKSGVLVGMAGTVREAQIIALDAP